MATVATIAGPQRAVFFLQHYYPCTLQQLINGRLDHYRANQIKLEVVPLLSCEEILHIGASIANGLCHLQEYGIAHRDLTPDNIWISPPSTTGLYIHPFIHPLHHIVQYIVQYIYDMISNSSYWYTTQIR